VRLILDEVEMRLTFSPQFEVVHRLPVQPTRDLEWETLLYQSSREFAERYGGPVTKQFLDLCPLENPIIDVRVHHLQKGQYPAIPGYHLDWIPRRNKGQNPDLTAIPDATHYMLIVGIDSLTEFVAETVTFDLPDENPFAYVTDQVKQGAIRRRHALSGSIVKFTSHDWHTATRAEGPEWRLLIRASDVARRPVNEIRKFSQVYIPIQEASW
jgi:hypothetical protein